MAALYTLGWGTAVETVALGVTINSMALNQSTDKLVTVFQAQEDVTVTRLGFRYVSRTGTPPTYRISLQGIDSSGNEDGTVKGGGSPASATFTPPADATWNSTFRWVNLANSYAAARGEVLAWVIEYSSGTVDGSNNSSFARSVTNGSQSLPYAIVNDAGSRTRVSALPLWGYGSATRAYGRPFQSSGLAGGATFGPASGTNEFAARWTVPMGLPGRYTVAGVRASPALNAAHAAAIRLYRGGNAGDTAVAAELSVDIDAVVGSRVPGDFYFPTLPPPLEPGETVRMSYLATSGTNHSLNLHTAASADDWQAWPYWCDCGYSTRGGGNWTDADANRLDFVPLLADVSPVRTARTRPARVRR